MIPKKPARKIFAASVVSLCFLPASTLADVFNISDDTASDEYPSLYNGTIAWESDASGHSEIFYWDGATTRNITENIVGGKRPSLYNETIAFESTEDREDVEIFFWDGVSTRQITHNAVYDLYPSLYNGTIAWQGIDEDGDWEIYYWDGTAIHQITENTLSDRTPSLYDGKIAWERNGQILYWDGSDGTGSHIYFWDGHDIKILATNPGSGTLWYPSNHNGEVAWQGQDGDINQGDWNWEIFLWGSRAAPRQNESLRPLSFSC